MTFRKEIRVTNMVLEEKNYPLSAIAHATNRIFKSPSADEVLHVLSEESRLLIGAHQAVARLSIGGKVLLSASSSEKYGHLAAERIEPSNFQWFPECDDRPVRLAQEEFESHSAWIQPSSAHEEFPPMGGCLSAPFVGRSGKKLGLIRLSDKYRGDFSETDEGILEHLVAIAMAAIQNFRIGEQKYLLNDELQRAQSLLEFAGSLVRLGAWSVDLETNRVNWSDEVCAIHECPTGTIPTVEEGINFYTPEWREIIKGTFAKCARDGTPYDMELEIQTAKGRRLWVRTRGEPERDEGGKIVRVRGAFQDITDLKEAKEEALHLAARLSSTLESITDAFFTVDRDWRFTYLNKEAETLMRCRREDLLGKNLWDEFKEAVGTKFYTEYHRALDTQVRAAFEEYYPPLESWFQVRAYPSSGGLAVYFLNVTAERKAKKALEESEIRFRALADTATAAIWDWNIDTGQVWWSNGFKIHFGYDLAEDENSADLWRRRIHPDDRERVLAELDIQLRGNGTTYSSEYRLLRKDDSVAQVVDRGFISRDAHGRAVRAIGRMSDRTKVYESQKQLRDRAALLEKTNSAIILCSLDYRILFWNAGAERLYGWTAAEAVGNTVSAVSYNDSLLFKEATEATKRFGEWSGEMTHHRKNGAAVKVEGHWTLVRDDEGHPHAILAVNTDLTKRLETEQQVLRSQRLEAIGQLTGGIAHDFNNLLTVILGNSEVLVEQLSDDERLSPLASMIQTAAERGGDLTNHLLAFARRQALDPKVLDVYGLVKRMDGLLRRTLGEHVELELVAPDNLWKALADETQLESAILNVCINARDAMRGGGRLVIQTANVQLNQNTAENLRYDLRPGNYVMIAISDTGCGMSEEVLSRAFEPFFTTKEIGEGSGLGLSMVYGFAKQSGGYIRIASEVGYGTTVKLYLPRVDQPSEVLPELHPKSTDMLTGTENILLVEDEEIVRSYVRQLLTRLGYNVSAAANGPEALAALKTAANYDLLFTDVVMPGGLDGWQLADEARRIRPDLKVLFTSGYSDNGVRRGPRRGTVLLSKPYKPHELATKIRLALRDTP